MKTFEETFREHEAKFRKYRKELNHDLVINKLALIVRSADQVIDHYRNRTSQLDGKNTRLRTEREEYKAAMYRFMYMAAASVLANVILITLLMR